MSHSPDFHKSADARKACWGCNGEGKLDISEADWEVGRQLVIDGWFQGSHRHRLVRRLDIPSFDFCFRRNPGAPDWLYLEVARHFEDFRRSGVWRPKDSEIEERHLTMGEFRAFRKLLDLYEVDTDFPTGLRRRPRTRTE